MVKSKLSTTTAVILMIAVGAAYAVLVLPFLQGNAAFGSLDPITAYIIYNVGFILLFSGLLGSIVTAALKKKFSVLNVLIDGAAVFLIFSFTYDMLQGPFFLSPAGQPIIQETGGTLVNTAVDAMMSYVYHYWFGVPYSPMLYYLVYGFTPILAIIIAGLVFGPKRLLRTFSGGGA